MLSVLSQTFNTGALKRVFAHPPLCSQFLGMLVTWLAPWIDWWLKFNQILHPGHQPAAQTTSTQTADRKGTLKYPSKCWLFHDIGHKSNNWITSVQQPDNISADFHNTRI